MFKIMTSVLSKSKSRTDSEIEKIPSYIFCRWLSGNPITIQAANLFNQYDKIPIVNQFKMVKSAFAGKINYIPYPKNNSKDELKSLEYLQKYFNINLEQAKEHMEFISQEELAMITNLYT